MTQVTWDNPKRNTTQVTWDGGSITFGLNEEGEKMVLGGEVALWSEQSDGTVMDGRIWPRGSAMADSLWSGNQDEMGRKRSGEAVDRLNEWRHRMVGRGIRAEPIQPLCCVKNPGMCNTAHASLTLSNQDK